MIFHFVFTKKKEKHRYYKKINFEKLKILKEKHLVYNKLTIFAKRLLLFGKFMKISAYCVLKRFGRYVNTFVVIYF
jgi:hypothetical protein